jgi:hypothetical protein
MIGATWPKVQPDLVKGSRTMERRASSLRSWRRQALGYLRAFVR